MSDPLDTMIGSKETRTGDSAAAAKHIAEGDAHLQTGDREKAVDAYRAARNADGQRVLDAFCYDGLFGVRAAMAGASEVLCLEQNQAAVERLQDHAARNGVADKVKVERTNCMQALRDLAEEREPLYREIADVVHESSSRSPRRVARDLCAELNRAGVA